jgi:flagellar basal-body rod modification protein FlgD
MSIAATAAAANSATAASTAQSVGSTAATSLGSNLNDFLKLLMTQLQNQDPTSPLDTNQFTSQLVQFASVEQQVNTNSNLGQLIQLTQSDQMLQSSAMVGHVVSVNANQLSLQEGNAAIGFTTSQAGPVSVNVSTPTGMHLASATITPTPGSNTWTWNGKDTDGTKLPDGAYNLTVTQADSTGTQQPLAFSVIGTATGVQKAGTSMQLDLGSLAVDLSAVQSVLN